MVPLLLIVLVSSLAAGQHNNHGHGHSHQTTTAASISSQDHLLQVLNAMHHSDMYQHLTSSEKVLLTELLSAAETDSVTHYIQQVGLPKILSFLNHATRLDFHETHLLENYLTKELLAEVPQAVGRKRALTDVLIKLRHDAVIQALSPADKTLFDDIIDAASKNTLTQLIDQRGMAAVFKLLSDIDSSRDSSIVITYLNSHLQQEAHSHGHGSHGHHN